MDPIEVPRLVDQLNGRWKVIFVGDAAMAPGELLGTGPWGSLPGERSLSGLDWLTFIHERFERSVWLNPDPPEYWNGGTAKAISEVIPMHHLTLEGLAEAMAHLSKGPTAKLSHLSTT